MKFIRFKGKWEVDGVGIVFGIYCCYNQVIVVGGGVVLYIGDQVWDGVRFEEYYYYGGEDQVIFVVKVQVVEVFYCCLQIIQLFGGVNIFQIVDVYWIFILCCYCEVVCCQIKVVMFVVVVQIQCLFWWYNCCGMQYFGMGVGQVVFLIKIICVMFCYDFFFLFRSVFWLIWSNSFLLINSNVVCSSSRLIIRLLKINSGIVR